MPDTITALDTASTDELIEERADHEAWEGICQGCGLHCVLFEQVEFVCGRCHGEIVPGALLPARLGRPVADDDPLGQLLWHIDWCIFHWQEHGVPDDLDLLENYIGLRSIADQAAKRRAEASDSPPSALH